MKCAAHKVEFDLMPNHSVQITLRCRGAYEAAVLFDEIAERATRGSLSLSFGLENVEVHERPHSP
jgi:hypothetical protein